MSNENKPMGGVTLALTSVVLLVLYTGILFGLISLGGVLGVEKDFLLKVSGALGTSVVMGLIAAMITGVGLRSSTSKPLLKAGIMFTILYVGIFLFNSSKEVTAPPISDRIVPTDEIEAKTRASISRTVGVPQSKLEWKVVCTAKLRDCESEEYVKILLGLEKEFGVTFSDQLLDEFEKEASRSPSVYEFAVLVTKALKTKGQ